jgi:hypothetical protein
MIAASYARESPDQTGVSEQKGWPMESFEAIQQKEFAHLTGEIGTLGRKLVELEWSKEQVLDYVKQQFH